MTRTTVAPSGRRGLAATLLVAVALFGLLAACGDGGSSSSSIPLTPAGEKGRALADRSGCAGCHSTDGSRKVGPTWEDLAGSEVELEGGETVVATDDYLRESITDPKAKAVAGFTNTMPAFSKLSDEELDQLIAYLHDLSKLTTKPANAGS